MEKRWLSYKPIDMERMGTLLLSWSEVTHTSAHGLDGPTLSDRSSGGPASGEGCLLADSYHLLPPSHSYPLPGTP